MNAAVGISETSNFQAQLQIPNGDLNLKPTFDSNNQSYSNSDAANLLNVCYDDYDEYQEQSLASKQTALNDQEILEQYKQISDQIASDSVETLQTLNQQDLKERCDQNQIELQDDAKTAVSANHGGQTLKMKMDKILNLVKTYTQESYSQQARKRQERSNENITNRVVTLNSRVDSENLNNYPQEYRRHNYQNHGYNQNQNYNRNYQQRRSYSPSDRQNQNYGNSVQKYREQNNQQYQQRYRSRSRDNNQRYQQDIIKEGDRTKEAIRITIITSNDPIIMAAIINLTNFKIGQTRQAKFKLLSRLQSTIPSQQTRITFTINSKTQFKEDIIKGKREFTLILTRITAVIAEIGKEGQGRQDLEPLINLIIEMRTYPLIDLKNITKKIQGNNVYIAGIPRWVNESDLLKTFEKYGKILEVKVIRDHITKNSKGFAYVLYERSSDAQRAIEGLDGVRVYNEWMLKVELAKRALPYEPRHNIQMSNSISGQEYGSENDRKLQEINIRKQDFLLERGVEIQREEQFIERERKNFHKYQEKERNLNEQRNQDNESNKLEKAHKIMRLRIIETHMRVSKESHENLKQNEQASSHKVDKERSRSKKSLEKKRRSHSKEKQILSRERKHIKSSSRKKNEKIRNDEDQRRDRRSRDHSDMRIDEKSRDRHQNRRSRSRENHQSSYQNMRDSYPNRPNGYYNNNNRQNNHQHYNNNHQQNNYQNSQRNNYHNNNSQAQRGGHYDNQRNGYQNYGRDHQNQQRYQQQQQYRDYKR
eukprot:403362029